MNLTTVILAVLVIGTSLQRCSRTLAAPVSRPQNKLPCANEEIVLTACKKYEFYVDGIALTLPNAGVWQKTDKTKLYSTANVMAVKVTKSESDYGGLLVCGKYFVTDRWWKCTNKHYKGWPGANFDDTAWPQATEIGSHGVSPWGNISGMCREAKWIWTPKYTNGRDSDCVIYCRYVRDCKCNGTGQSCVSRCNYDYDGEYQSCKGCDFFAACYYGVMYDEQSCEAEGHYFDDNLKQCVNQTSSTCRRCSNDETTTAAATTTYLTTKTTKTTRATTVTTQPTTTSNPTTSVQPTTLTTLIETTSNRKQTTVCTTGPTCITSCRGLADGEYQSCRGCHVYASCHYENLVDEHPCKPYGSYWDDYLKSCQYQSRTCKRCPDEETTTTLAVTTYPTHAATTEGTTVCTSGLSCITSCTGRMDGEYQSCKGCRVYAKCFYGVLEDEVPCSHDELLYWDDQLKQCSPHSTTCQSCTSEEATTFAVTTEQRHTTTTPAVCPTERPYSSCCSKLKGDDSSCSNFLFYLICKMSSHL